MLAHGGRIARQEWCGKGYVYRDKTLETLVLIEKAGDGEAVTEGWTPVADDVASGLVLGRGLMLLDRDPIQ